MFVVLPSLSVLGPPITLDQHESLMGQQLAVIIGCWAEIRAGHFPTEFSAESLKTQHLLPESTSFI